MDERMKKHPIYIVRRDPSQNEVRYKCPVEGCEGRMFLHTGKYGKYWKCHTCGLSLSDMEGEPQKSGKCPACGQILVRIMGKNGWFWGCKNSQCKKTFSDENGEPKS